MGRCFATSAIALGHRKLTRRRHYRIDRPKTAPCRSGDEREFDYVACGWPS
jgi:hypothetical protein